MNWKKLIKALMDAGMTQTEIAAHCGCKQSTVSDLYRNITATPNFNTGQKLIELMDSKRNKTKKRAPIRASR